MTQQKIDLSPINLNQEEKDLFPILFDPDFSYPRVDRVAGFWITMGLETEIIITGAGYVLALKLPEAG